MAEGTFTVDTRDVKKLERELTTFATRSVPYAVRNGLNGAAFAARREWVKQVKASFTLRNTYTERSIRVVKASGTDPGAMVARLGSEARFMGEQERGGIITGKSGRKPIPGPSAAGQAPGSRRTKVVRAGNRLGAIHVAHPRLTGSRKQRNAIAMAVARRLGQKRALLERPSGAKAIFQLTGRGKSATTRLLWDVSRATVLIRPAPTLQTTLKVIGPEVERIHVDAMVEQLRRAKILGY